MTLKKMQILGVQVAMAHSLMRYEQQFGEAAPFSAIGLYDTSLYRGALAKLLKEKIVKRAKIKNFGGRGARPAYLITDAGREWYQQARVQYDELLKQTIHK